MSPSNYIVRDPEICGGEPVVKGTRVPIRTILASLAEGAWLDEILADFPTLTEDAVRAVIAFAAASAEEDTPVPDFEFVVLANGREVWHGQELDAGYGELRRQYPDA